MAERVKSSEPKWMTSSTAWPDETDIHGMITLLQGARQLDDKILKVYSPTYFLSYQHQDGFQIESSDFDALVDDVKETASGTGFMAWIIGNGVSAKFTGEGKMTRQNSHFALLVLQLGDEPNFYLYDSQDKAKSKTRSVSERFISKLADAIRTIPKYSRASPQLAPFRYVSIPQQINGSDCGFFALATACIITACVQRGFLTPSQWQASLSNVNPTFVSQFRTSLANGIRTLDFDIDFKRLVNVPLPWDVPMDIRPDTKTSVATGGTENKEPTDEELWAYQRDSKDEQEAIDVFQQHAPVGQGSEGQHAPVHAPVHAPLEILDVDAPLLVYQPTESSPLPTNRRIKPLEKKLLDEREEDEILNRAFADEAQYEQDVLQGKIVETQERLPPSSFYVASNLFEQDYNKDFYECPLFKDDDLHRACDIVEYEEQYFCQQHKGPPYGYFIQDRPDIVRHDDDTGQDTTLASHAGPNAAAVELGTTTMGKRIRGVRTSQGKDKLLLKQDPIQRRVVREMEYKAQAERDNQRIDAAAGLLDLAHVHALVADAKALLDRLKQSKEAMIPNDVFLKARVRDSRQVIERQEKKQLVRIGMQLERELEQGEEEQELEAKNKKEKEKARERDVGAKIERDDFEFGDEQDLDQDYSNANGKSAKDDTKSTRVVAGLTRQKRQAVDFKRRKMSWIIACLVCVARIHRTSVSLFETVVVRERSSNPLNPSASIPKMFGISQYDEKGLKQQAKLIKNKALQILTANFVIVNPFDAPIDRIVADVRHNVVHVMARKGNFLADLASLLSETADRHAVTFSPDEFARLEPVVYDLTNRVRTLGGNSSGGDVFERVQYDMREGLELKYAIGIATVLVLSHLLSKPAKVENKNKDVATLLQQRGQSALEIDNWFMIQAFDQLVWYNGMSTVATETKKNADFFKTLARVRGVIKDEYNKYGANLVKARIITPDILQSLRSLRNDIELTHGKQKSRFDDFGSGSASSQFYEEARKRAAYDKARQVTENLARIGMGNLGRTVTTTRDDDDDSDVVMSSRGDYGSSGSASRTNIASARNSTTDTAAPAPTLKTRIGPGVY